MKVLARLWAVYWRFVVLPASTRSQHIMALGRVWHWMFSDPKDLGVGNKTLSVEEALVQSTSVMLTCYGHRECSSLTDAGQNEWSQILSHSILVLHRSFDVFHLQMTLFSWKTCTGTHASSNIGHWSKSANHESTETWMNLKRRFNISKVAEEVLHSSSRRPYHDPQYITSIQEWYINLCMSLCKFHFHIRPTLENSFVLVFVLVPQ